MPEDIEKIKRELEAAKEEIKIRDQAIVNLNKKIEDFQRKLNILQRERPKLTSKNLISSFKTALEKMQEGLQKGEGRVDYVVSRFDTDLKLNVTLDEQGNINFQFPKLEDIIPSENLSTLHLSIKSVPKTPVAPRDTVEVPNLIGMAKDVAMESIKKANLEAGKITERVSLTAPGTVVEQDPVPYSRILIGSCVDLIISKIREVKVPNVIGMDKSNAIDTIRISELTIGKITEEISDAPPGAVISQSITAGTIVSIGTSIDLVIAKPEMTKVPEVVGKKREEAIKIIKRAKLKVGRVVEKKSEKPAGTIIEQTPEAGREVTIGTSIDLVIAKPEMTKVPEVVGKKKEEAIKIIKRAKLKVGRVLEKKSEKPVGTIIEQIPEAGREVSIGTSIDLVIAKFEMT